MKKAIVFFAALILVSSVALALNPVVVGPTGDYAIIEDAISSWCDGGTNSAEAAPFVIQIDPAGSYDESLTLNDTWSSGSIVGDLEIKSSVPGTLPVIKLQLGISGGDDGLHIYQSRFDITFTDLLFCPSQTNPVLDDFIKIDENTDTTPTIANNIEFYNCIITDVDAAGDPAVTSKADIIAMDYPSSITAFVSGSSFASGDMLMKWWGDAGENVSGKLVDCGFWVKNGYGARIHLDGSSGEAFEIKDCVFATGLSWHAAIEADPIVAGQIFTITGTTDPCAGDLENCTAILSAGWHAIWGGGAAGTTLKIDNVLIDNDDVFGTDDSRAISHGNGDLVVEDVISNIRTDPGMIVDYPTNAVWPDTFKRCTFHMEAPAPTAWLYTGSLPDPGGIQFIDCSISGNGVGAWTTAVPGQGVELINCIVATSGADAISTLGLNPITFTDCKFIDPAYVSKDRKVEGFMDPTDASLLYAGAWPIGTVGGVSLGGGGDYGGLDAGDIANNTFKDWGDCEGDIFTIPSYRSNWKGAGLAEVQKQGRGVIGLGLLVNHTSGRLEAGTDEEDISGYTDGGEQFSFFYRIPTIMYSYPRVALRLDPDDPPFIVNGEGESGDVGVNGGVIVWQNSSFIIDDNWHIFRADVDSLDFGPAVTANFFTNNYAVPEWNLDEIVLTDGPEALTEVQDWGLF